MVEDKVVVSLEDASVGKETPVDNDVHVPVPMD